MERLYVLASALFVLIASVPGLESALAQTFAEISPNPPRILVPLSFSGITLTASSSDLSEGDSVTLSGSYFFEGKRIPKQTITIWNDSYQRVLGTIHTDGNGDYALTWDTTSKDVGAHKIRASAVSYDDKSVMYEKTVGIKIQPLPVLAMTLNAEPLSATEGDLVTFYGSFLTDGSPNSDYLIVVRDYFDQNKIIGSDRTDLNGQYRITWPTTGQDVGSYTFVSEVVPDKESPFTIPESFMSNRAFFTVSALPDCTVELIASPKMVEENSLVNIQGTLECASEYATEIFGYDDSVYGDFDSDRSDLRVTSNNDSDNNNSEDNTYSVFNRYIEIRDRSENDFLVSTVTDDNGFFSVNWKAIYKNTPYDLYAIFVDDDTELATSNIETITVTQPENAKLFLKSLEDIKPNSQVKILGYISEDGFEGQRVLIRDGGSIVDTTTISIDRSFSASFHVSDDFLGEKQISAECDCDERYLKSNIVTLSVIPEPPKPLQIQIIPNTTYGESPLQVTLSAQVTGGTPPYTYDWNLSGTKYNSKSIYHTYNMGSEKPYEVFLLVTDSLGYQERTGIGIKVNEPYDEADHKTEIRIMGERLEGSAISFTAVGSSLKDTYSFEWSFGDGNFGNARSVTHVYGDNGQYPVKLVIQSPRETIMESTTLDIQNRPPEISNLYSQTYEIAVNDVMEFEGEFTDASRDDTFTVMWYIDDKQFTDNTDSSQTQVEQDYKFEKPGKYTITLIVEDDDGDQDKRTISIHVMDEEQFPWLAVVVAVVAGAGVAAFAIAKAFTKPNPSPGTQQPSTSTTSQPPNNPPPSPVITIEYKSGVER